MAVKKLKMETVNALDKELKVLSGALQDNREYDHYRGILSSEEENVINLELLTCTENGMFKRLSITYDMTKDKVYYDSKHDLSKHFNSIHGEENLKKAIKSFIAFLPESLMISRVFFDVNLYYPLIKGYLKNSTKDVGTHDLYLEVKPEICYTYNYSDAIPTCGADLCGYWSDTE